MLWPAEFFNDRYPSRELRRFDDIRRLEAEARELRAEYLRASLSRAGHRLTTSLARVVETARTGWMAVREGARRRRRRAVAIRELSALDDRSLKDIGLNRGEIYSVVRDLIEGNHVRRARPGGGAGPQGSGTPGGGGIDRNAQTLRRAA